MDKFCVDCKYSAARGCYPNAALLCKHPKNTLTLVDVVTGLKTVEPIYEHCSTQRSDGTFWLLSRSCGKPGRWFEPK